MSRSNFPSKRVVFGRCYFDHVYLFQYILNILFRFERPGFNGNELNAFEQIVDCYNNLLCNIYRWNAILLCTDSL